MDAEIKRSFSPKVILGLTLSLVALFALLDVLNATDWLLYPYSQIKGKFSKSGS